MAEASRVWLWLPTVLALSISACSLAPDYRRPNVPVAGQWLQPLGAGSVAQVPDDWRVFVTDASLRNLIDQALANNRDLRQAMLNVQAARALYRIERAARLPHMAAQGSGVRQRVPADLRTEGSPAVQSEYQVGLGLAAFELDLFGRVRNLSEAALQQYLATGQGAESARISLVSEVIQAYLVRDGALRRQLLTRHTLEARQASFRLIEQRREQGAASELDLLEAQGLAEQAAGDLEQIERERRQADNALRLLVGIADLHGVLAQAPSAQPVLLQAVSVGLPSELLTRRPDIRAAEHLLRARNADIGAARAAFFPQISLTGSWGTASSELSDLFTSGQRAWSFAPQISVPIFQGGRLRANLDLARVREDIAVAGYEQAVQAAFREVSDALAATDTLAREEQARARQAQMAGRALHLASARYETGEDDYLRYLDAQRTAFASEIGLIETATQRQLALTALFRALGAGWQPPERLAAITPVDSNEVSK